MNILNRQYLLYRTASLALIYRLTSEGWDSAPSIPSHSPSLCAGSGAFSTTDDLFQAQKKVVGYKAVHDFVKSGMVVGIGTGTTTLFALRRIKELLKSGEIENVTIVPCSKIARNYCEKHLIPTTSISEALKQDDPSVSQRNLDVLIDGADEVDLQYNLLKGGHGSMIREKMMGNRADRCIIVIDERKLQMKAGMAAPLVVEILATEAHFTISRIQSLPAMQGSRGVIRMGTRETSVPDGMAPAESENRCLLVDFFLPHRATDIDYAALSAELDAMTGVVAHGYVSLIYIATI